MNEARSTKSEKLQKHQNDQPEDVDDFMHSPFKDLVAATKERIITSPSPEKKVKPISHVPSIYDNDSKSLMSEQVRIKGQAKLLYLKQCRQKKWSKEQILLNFPFSRMEAFVFHDQLLRDETGNIHAHIIQDEKGIHLVQEYQQNKPKSKYRKVHENEEEGQQFNGLSVSVFNDGSIFEGNYHDGKFCGLGYEMQSNGNSYVGMFKDGIKRGYGTYYWFDNNQIYAGEWLGGLPHGEGMYLGKDKYQGTFSNGLKFGFGEECFSNGDRYIGTYANSAPEGYGEYYWLDGSVYRGDFKQGVRHGYGIWEDKKEIYKGCYRMDKKQGFGIYKWKNKQIYKGEFRQDYRDGYGQFFNLVKDDKEILIYKGCWSKGKKNESGKVDENTIKQLYSFLDQKNMFDKYLEDQKNREEGTKRRVGHRNCIPEEQHRHSRSNRRCKHT